VQYLEQQCGPDYSDLAGMKQACRLTLENFRATKLRNHKTSSTFSRHTPNFKQRRAASRVGFVEDAQRESEVAHKWWMELRRASMVPDLVGDENARSYLAQLIGKTGEIRSLDPLALAETALKTLEFVFTLAAEGTLDIVVLNKNVTAGEVCNANATRLICDQHVEAVARNLGPGTITTLCDQVRVRSEDDLEH
jgi:hypothetical protein